MLLTGPGYRSLLPAATCAGVRRLDLAGVYWISPGALLTKLLCMSSLTHLAVQDVRFTSRQFNCLLNQSQVLSDQTDPLQFCQVVLLLTYYLFI